VDTHNQYCPYKDCSYFGWVGLGNIRANGHPNGGRRRQLHCTVCDRYFMETEGTIFYRSRTPAEIIWRALQALAEGLSIQATARVFEVDPNTVETRPVEAAAHAEAVSRYLIHDLHLTQVQVDELWALPAEVTPEAESRLRRIGRWVWVALGPVSKPVIAWVVGDRSLVTARLLIHAVAQALAPGVVPLFLSDQPVHYATALLTHFGHRVETPRRFARGRLPAPRWLPLPQLQYAQVVKERVKGRVVRVSRHVVFGTAEAVAAALAATGLGKIINTAFIERRNLSVRRHMAALGRKVLSLAKTEPGLKRQPALGWAYYNFVLPHTALREPLPRPLPTKGDGSPKRRRPRTPAMAAGLTDHVWSMSELLCFRVPPRPQAVTA
jgi:IS1 family transposase/transposase-like protein